MSTEPMTSEKAAWFPSLNHAGEAIALVDGERSLTYDQLNDAVSRVFAGLLNGEASLEEERVAFLYPASFDYAALIIAVVAAGGIAVPLSVHASAGELSHCLSVAGVRRLLLPSEMRSEALDAACDALGVEQLAVEDLPDAPVPHALPLAAEQGALIVFTSGTTGKP
jgi:malonyl-CoA/methylmalonyl-CoA synthetase